MVGFFVGFLVYPLLSEILCIAHLKEGILNDITLVDKASGIFCIFYGFGSLLAIVMGNFMVSYIRTDKTV